MKIGVIGAGRIGSSLGQAWSAAGHDVAYGVRDTSKAEAKELAGKVTSVAEAAAHGEVILFAVPGGSVVETVKSLNLSGKIILDATNGGGTGNQPVVQAIAEAAPQSSVYKAFNTLGFENFQNPAFGDLRADLLFIGPESQRAAVEALISDVGLNPVYVGGLDQTAALDAALSLWFTLSRRFGRHLAFKVLHDGA